MFVVAIHGVTGDPASNAQRLAAVLGVTAYDARGRVMAAAKVPAVVATTQFVDQARSTVEALGRAGFHAFGISEEGAYNLVGFEVQRFELRPDVFAATTATGHQTALPWADIRLMVRGSRLPRTGAGADGPSVVVAGGRARVSVDGDFWLLLGTEGPAVVLRIDELDFRGLGADMKMSAKANYHYLLEEIRRRATGAYQDERLLRHQKQMLGPTLEEELHAPIAVGLVVQSLIEALKAAGRWS